MKTLALCVDKEQRKGERVKEDVRSKCGLCIYVKREQCEEREAKEEKKEKGERKERDALGKHEEKQHKAAELDEAKERKGIK